MGQIQIIDAVGEVDSMKKTQKSQSAFMMKVKFLPATLRWRKGFSGILSREWNCACKRDGEEED